MKEEGEEKELSNPAEGSGSTKSHLSSEKAPPENDGLFVKVIQFYRNYRT